MKDGANFIPVECTEGGGGGRAGGKVQSREKLPRMNVILDEDLRVIFYQGLASTHWLNYKAVSCASAVTVKC
jgi:hypothetical protein